jgi:hypothetical protein
MVAVWFHLRCPVNVQYAVNERGLTDIQDLRAQSRLVAGVFVCSPSAVPAALSRGQAHRLSCSLWLFGVAVVAVEQIVVLFVFLKLFVARFFGSEHFGH